ncbi:hypothetical protein BDR26DRAFT_995585 [Obelidium mucronatum]|nr:hypothetical protein BDR26DRAFT_995585 [Obelidium mucronatum]
MRFFSPVARILLLIFVVRGSQARLLGVQVWGNGDCSGAPGMIVVAGSSRDMPSYATADITDRACHSVLSQGSLRSYAYTDDVNLNTPPSNVASKWKAYSKFVSYYSGDCAGIPRSAIFMTSLNSPCVGTIDSTSAIMSPLDNGAVSLKGFTSSDCTGSAEVLPTFAVNGDGRCYHGVRFGINGDASAISVSIKKSAAVTVSMEKHALVLTSLIASREDIAAQLKHLSPSAKDWVSLVTRQALKNKDATAAAAAPSVSGRDKDKEKDKDKGKDRAKDKARAADADADAGRPKPPNTDADTDADADADADSQLDDFDDLVKFVFDSNAQNPWDERLYKWVMQSFDRNSAFLTDDDAAPLTEAAVKSIVGAEAAVAPLVANLAFESGGRVSLPVSCKDALKKATKIASSAAMPPPKMTTQQLQLELASISAAIDKERERYSLKVKDICDPYLNKSIKSMNALYDFDDAITDNYLNDHIRKMLKKKLEQSNTISSFDNYWTEVTKPFIAPVKPQKGGKKPALPATSNAIDQNDVSQIDKLWENYLENMTAAADLTVEFISNETVSQIVLAAELLQENLLLSLDEMVQQTQKTTITSDTQEIIDGTKMNLNHFKEFLQTESALHRAAHLESRAALNTIIQELQALYTSMPASATVNPPTVRGRLERTRSKEFVKKIKQLDQEMSQFRSSLLSNLQEFAENIQWDGLVLGVEVVGACLDICEDDLAAAHAPIQKMWMENVASGLLYDKLELMNSLYRDGIRFGVFEYVKAVGKPLLEALNRLGPVAAAPAVAAVSAAVPAPTAVPAVTAASTVVTATAASGVSVPPPPPADTMTPEEIAHAIDVINDTTRAVSATLAAAKSRAAAATATTASSKKPASVSVASSSTTDAKQATSITTGAVSESTTKKKKNKKSGKKSKTAHKAVSSSENEADSEAVVIAASKPVIAATVPKDIVSEQNSAVVAQESGADADSEEDDDLDAAIPPQYVHKSASNEAISVAVVEAPSSKSPLSVPDAFGQVPQPSKKVEVPVWPGKPITQASNSDRSQQQPQLAPQSQHILPTNLQQQKQQQQQQQLAPLNSQQQLGTPSAEEFHNLRVAYSRAMHEISKLHNDANLFLQEIHRLNAELSHWKSIASLHSQQQQQQQPSSQFFGGSASSMTSGALQQQQQQQQQQQFFAPPGFGMASGGPPGISVPGQGSSSNNNSNTSNGPSSNGASIGGGPSTPLGDLFLNSQFLTGGSSGEGGAKDGGSTNRNSTDVAEAARKSMVSGGGRSRSPVSWRRQAGGEGGFLPMGSSGSNNSSNNNNNNSNMNNNSGNHHQGGVGLRSGSGGMGAIGGEKRVARPTGLLVNNGQKDPNSVRRAFFRGARDLRCGNCGEAGHESNGCKAPCRYCDQIGHLAAQCPF